MTTQKQLRTTFDDVAAQYDRARPGYPAALVDDVIALSSIPPKGRILEIGSGTGQATQLFAQRGYRIDGIELGANLADVARRKFAAYPNVSISVGDFEYAEIADGVYDLGISAQAFHWIEPEIGYPKLARALKPGGSIALFWNKDILTEAEGGFFASLQPIYEREAPSLIRDPFLPPRPEDVDFPVKEDIDRSGLFGEVTVRTYRWEREFTAQGFLDVVGTYSNHLAADPAQREGLFRGIADLIDRQYGGRIIREYLAVLYFARRT